MPADVQDWKLLLELELSRGEAALSGDAYATLSEMIAKTLPLSQSECRILRRPGAEPSYVVRHGELAEALWGGSAAATHDRGALRQHVTSLRRKLSELRVGVGAVPSIGYRLSITREPPDE